MTKSSLTARRLVLCALFAALCAVCSQIAIPLPMVPINLALFAVHLSGTLLGPRYGTLSMLAYILLGLVGVPVFQGFTAGGGILFGPTGGYILGYLLAAAIAGLTVRRAGNSFWKLCAGMACGVLACYLAGTVWFMVLMQRGLWESLLACVFPFLPGDAVKIALAAVLTLKLRPIMEKNGWA